ncbi:MAG: preprotein translocase subunit SecG [Verrucomicrobia bacterium]|nr:MAG: preprotein translocase subunit SecG [Verrucomicrobiota bacterium]
MGSLILGVFTLALVIVCVLLVLVILMQRPNANSGMGAALGGGAAESTFGGEAGNVLTRATVKLTVLFFVLAAGLYMGYIYLSMQKDDTAPTNLSISAVAEKAASGAQQAAQNPASAASGQTSAASQAKQSPAASQPESKPAAAPSGQATPAQAEQKPAMPANSDAATNQAKQKQTTQSAAPEKK